MSDYSMFSLFTAGLACLVPFTAAYTQPKGDSPSGNPISQPGLNSVVPAGKPFTVTWQPTTPGTVTLLLLKGPSSNAVPQYPIVENYDNNGSFVWTPSTSLAPTDNAQGYGIQLIVDATGQYQYTTQFGISNANYNGGSSSSASGSSTTCTDSSSATAPASSTQKSVWSTVTAYYTAPCNSTVPLPTGGAKPGNVTMIPGGYTPPAMTTAVQPSSPGSATASASNAKYTGGAATLAGTSFAGLVMAAGAAVFAL